jgi:hypothetical protein
MVLQISKFLAAAVKGGAPPALRTSLLHWLRAWVIRDEKLMIVAPFDFDF